MTSKCRFAKCRFAAVSAIVLALAAHAALSTTPNRIAQAIENRSDTGEVRPGSAEARVVRAQILLDRARFSPGQIDGRYGGDLGVAIKGYQEEHHLNPDGIIGPQMWRILDADKRRLLKTYTITAADLKGPFVPIPKDVQEQAQMKWMGYESAREELGEKFHLSARLLAELNPGKDLEKAGEVIVVPAVERGPARRAVRVVVSKSKRTVTAYGAGDKMLAQYPATMGGEHDPLPIGQWKITSVQHDPWFNYDPVHFWNANPEEAAAKLPPGPRNPAGVVWMGLSKAHYGIHGTPDPGRIRHGESAGCIRLTNWDAADRSHIVLRGPPASLEE
jgi:lipoprotein-anchoring transpeptidase ErfK/SrfK